MKRLILLSPCNICCIVMYIRIVVVMENVDLWSFHLEGSVAPYRAVSLGN